MFFGRSVVQIFLSVNGFDYSNIFTPLTIIWNNFFRVQSKRDG